MSDILLQFKTSLNKRIKENKSHLSMKRIEFMRFLSQTTIHYCQKISDSDAEKQIMMYVRQLLKQYSDNKQKKPIDLVYQLNRETSVGQNHQVLYDAIQNKDYHYIKELLKNNQNNQLYHAMQYAIHNEDEQSVRLIFQYGLMTKNQEKKLIKKGLHQVVRLGNENIFWTFLEYVPTIRNDNGSKCPLVFEIAHSKKIKFIEPLVKKGMNVHACNKYGDTVFHEAAKLEPSHFNDINIFWIEALIHKYKVNINATNHKGETPLYCASNVYEDNQEMILSLFMCGAEMNPTTTCPPLFGAIRAGSVDNINTLLKHSANPKVNYNGLTTLDCLNQTQEETFSPYVRSQLCKLFTPEPIKPTLIQRAKGVCQSIQKIFTR